VATWPTPSLISLRGTQLRAKDVSAFYTVGPRIEVRDGRRVVLAPVEYRQLKMEDQFDAVLWVEPPGARSIAGLTETQCADRRYVEMRMKGMRLALGMAGGGAEAEAAIHRLERYCDRQRRK
jgi:hypothetical protein